MHSVDTRSFVFFFTDTATTEIYTLSLTTLFRSVYEQAAQFARIGAGIQIGCNAMKVLRELGLEPRLRANSFYPRSWNNRRSEEHTSELQSHVNLVCRLLLEKKKKDTSINHRRVD